MMRIEKVSGGHRAYFYCDLCGEESSDKLSHYKRKKRHFCNTKCYSIFRKEKLPKKEQHAYGSGLPVKEREMRKRARSILNHAVRDGLLSRKPCETCGRKAQAHHDDYDKPLDVRWLCFYHHRKEHNQKPIYENPELLKEQS